MKNFKCRLRVGSSPWTKPETVQAQKKEDAAKAFADLNLYGTPVRSTSSLYVVGAGKQACFIEVKSA